jgi:DNA-binding CsgD family transcriptional regulator
MPDRVSATPCVALCDAQGRLVWTTNPDPKYPEGIQVWDYVTGKDADALRDHIARAVFLQQPQQFEATSQSGEYYRMWMWVWPITGKDKGVCIVGVRIPDEIKLLTPREHDCLKLMAVGKSSTAIAKALGVSLSTVHTFQRRAREKLQLSSLGALIAFASRYCFPSSPPLSKSARKAFEREWSKGA